MSFLSMYSVLLQVVAMCILLDGSLALPVGPSPVSGATLHGDSDDATILSDTDGKGARVPYAPNASYSWRIECPCSCQVWIQLDGFTEWDHDTVTVRLANGSNSVYSGHMDDVSLIIEANFTEVLFSSDSSIEFAGFTLNYLCLARDSCRSGTNTTTYDPETRSSRMLIRSDADGAASGIVTPKGESCQWSLSCLFPNNRIRVGANLSVDLLGSRSLLEVTSGGATTILSSMQQPTTTFDLPFSTAEVRFLSFMPSSGFDLSLTCSHALCTSLNASGTMFSGPNGTIISDTDGAGSASLYLQGEECAWAIQCPSQYKSIAVDTVAFLSVRDRLAIIPVVSGELEADQAVQLRGFACHNTIFAATTLQIRFYASMFASAGGFTIQYQCLDDGTVPSVAPPQPAVCGSSFSDSSGVIVSDADGEGVSELYNNDAHFYWTVDCRNLQPQATSMVVQISGATQQHHDNVTLRWGRTQQAVFSGSIDTVLEVRDSLTLNVEFVSDEAVSDRGFTLTYECGTFDRNSRDRTRVYVYGFAASLAALLLIAAVLIYYGRKRQQVNLTRETVQPSDRAEEVELDDVRIGREDVQEEAAPPPGGLVEGPINLLQPVKCEELCVVCTDKPSSEVLVPCGHAVLCALCASRVFAQYQRCPLCRAKIDGYAHWDCSTCKRDGGADVDAAMGSEADSKASNQTEMSGNSNDVVASNALSLPSIQDQTNSLLPDAAPAPAPAPAPSNPTE